MQHRVCWLLRVHWMLAVVYRLPPAVLKAVRRGLSMDAAPRAPWTPASQSAIILDGEPGSGVWKSSSDDRSYRSLRLPNGLRALLISDPRTDTAAAALSCGIGHMSDPWSIAGLSHFLEHMVGNVVFAPLTHELSAHMCVSPV